MLAQPLISFRLMTSKISKWPKHIENKSHCLARTAPMKSYLKEPSIRPDNLLAKYFNFE